MEPSYLDSTVNAVSGIIGMSLITCPFCTIWPAMPTVHGCAGVIVHLHLLIDQSKPGGERESAKSEYVPEGGLVKQGSVQKRCLEISVDGQAGAGYL